MTTTTMMQVKKKRKREEKETRRLPLYAILNPFIFSSRTSQALFAHGTFSSCARLLPNLGLKTGLDGVALELAPEAAPDSSAEIETHESLSTSDFIELPAFDPEVCVAEVCEGPAAVGTSSTSTTRTTALPSKTFLTLSASQFLDIVCAGLSKYLAWFDEGAVVVVPDPLNASQKAWPSLLNMVWLATAANIAACAAFCACSC